MPSIKTAISLDKELLDRIDELSKKMRISRSRLFTLAMNDYLRKQENQALLARLNKAYEDEPSEEEAMIRQSMKDKQAQVVDRELWE